MSRKVATTLAALLVFGTASAVLADANNRTDYLSSFDQRPLSMMSNGRTQAVNDISGPFATEKNASFAASQPALAQRPPSRRGITGKTIVWIKLTEPGGNQIHINLEHITSVRSSTSIPSARAQLDLTSGKFQGVQESVEQVMQLISAVPGARGDVKHQAQAYEQTKCAERGDSPMTSLCARNKTPKRHMKFGVVNGRTPRPHSFCASCCKSIGES